MNEAKMWENEAKMWKNRGEALGHAIEETIERTTKDSDERAAVIKGIRKALESNFRILNEDGEEREADAMDLLAIDLFHGAYLVYEDRQVELCRGLLELLKTVKEQRYDFFWQGFYRDKTLQPSRNDPPGYVLRTLLDQLSIDLQIAQAAVYQRQHPRLFEKTDDGWKLRQGTNLVATTQHAWSLFLADTLSEHALKPALDKGFFKQKYTPVVTYFEKSLSARLVPYANILLIGIPYSTFVEPVEANQSGEDKMKVGRSPDLLAIPHEVGHYLFWNAQVPETGETIEEYLRRRLEAAGIPSWDWRRVWLEEIFADAYGCLIAGPVIVLDFQDRLTDNLPEHFRRDPARHPIPILRPFIQSLILGKIRANGIALFKNVPKRLNRRWRKVIRKRSYGDSDGSFPLEAKYQIQGVAQLIQGQVIVDAVGQVVDVILESLGKILLPSDSDPARREPLGIPWTSDLGKDDGNIDKLYEQFFDKSFPVEDSWFEWPEKDIVSWKPALFSEENEEVKAKGVISEDHWKELFLIRGWSTEGPEQDVIK